MKNNIFVLTKILFKNGSGSAGKGNRKNRPFILVAAILVLALSPMVVQLVNFLLQAYDSLFGIGQQGLMLSLGLAVSSLLIFFFGIFYVLNTFYFSNDVEALLPLPLKPGQILGAKFIVTAIYEYITELVIIVPILIVYGVKSSADIIFWVYSLIIFIVLPVIPLALSSFFIMPVMRFTSVAKNKDRFRLVSSLVALAIGLGVNFAIQRFAIGTISPQRLQDLFLEGNNSLVGTISRLFPSSKLAVDSLLNTVNFDGILSLFIFVALSALAFILFQYLGELLYFKGVMGVSESSARRKKLTSVEFERNISKNPVLKSYILKELRVLFRTPVYFLNCVLMNFLYPVFLIFPFLAQSNGNQALGELSRYLDDRSVMGYVLAIAFGLIIFMSSSNGITSTSISREGQTLFVNKYLPVRYLEQIMAKVLTGVLMSGVGVISLIIAASIMFEINLPMVAGVLLTGFAGIIFTSFIGILIDLHNPKLNWDTEQKAVKQNLNLIFNMLVCSAAGGLAVFGVFMLKLDFIQALVGIVLLFGILDVILYYLLSTIGVERFRRIEA